MEVDGDIGRGASTVDAARDGDGEGAAVALLRRHAGWIERAAVVLSAAFALASLAAVPFVESWAERRYVTLYLAPLFAVFGWWARARMRDADAASPGRIVVDAVVVALAAARFAGGFLPLSGHMLFLTHAAGTTRGALRLAAVALLLETTWFKLMIWRDPASWGLGLAAGLAAVALYRRLPAGTRALRP